MKEEADLSQLLSVVVPMYNEAAVLAEFYAAVTEQLRATDHPYEIIFVDDGSIDDTPDEIERMIAQNPAVFLCRHDRNRGQSAAVRTGVLRTAVRPEKGSKGSGNTADCRHRRYGNCRTCRSPARRRSCAGALDRSGLPERLHCSVQDRRERI